MPGTYRCPAETGLYYLGERYYDPEIKRFISSDQLAEYIVPSMANLYVYCRNNPICYTDLLGMEPISALLRDGLIHDYVLLDLVVADKSLTMFDTGIRYKVDKSLIKQRWGFCDLYRPSTGEIWELKKNTGSYSCKTVNAKKQLDRYLNGTFIHQKELKPILPMSMLFLGNRYIHNLTIGDNVYDVTYWDEGNGILRYEYDETSSKYNKVTSSKTLFAMLGIGLGMTLASFLFPGAVGWGLGLAFA